MFGWFLTLYLHWKRAAQSQHRLEMILRAAKLGTWHWDLGEGRLTWDARSRNLMGIPLTESSGPVSIFLQNVHPDDRARANATCARALETGEMTKCEFQVVLPDGRERWIRIFGDAHRDSTGRPVAFSGAVIDFTDQAAAQHAQSQEAVRRRVLVEQSRDGIVVLDGTGKVHEANLSFAKMLGYTLEEAQGLHVWDWDEALPREQIREMINAIDESGDHFETKHRRKDGTIIDVEISTNAMEIGGHKHVFCVCRDVSWRNEATARLTASKAQLRSIFDGIYAFVTLLEYDGRIVEINRTALDTSGKNREEAIGQRLTDTMKWVQPRETHRRIEEAIEGARAGEVVRNELTTTDTNGEPVQLAALFSPLRNSSGSVTQVIVFGVDVTDRKILEEQMRQSQKMDAVGQLSAGVAHDFNNLLTVIQGNLALVAIEPALSMETQEWIQEIKTAADRAANLTRQLLTFSRQQSVQMRDCDLNTVLREVTTMLRRMLGETVEVVLELSAEPQLVTVDVGMIEQVMMNLAVNARDAMRNGGSLVVSTRTVPANEALAVSERPGEGESCVLLQVSDNGAGISEDMLPKIFDPFFTSKDTGKGTGLGLATVYGIVHQHGGSIQVDSTLGEGTSFSIYLPLSKTQRLPEMPAPVRPVDSCGGGETILLVEDENSLRNLLCNLFSRRGYSVITMPTARQAWDQWDELGEQVDILITDLVMPEGMSGKELADAATARKPNLPVIFMSGYSPEITGEHPELVEGVNYLAKPFELHRLMEAVRGMLARECDHVDRKTSVVKHD